MTYSPGYSSDWRFYRARTFTGYILRVLLIVWIIRGYIDFFPRAILSYIFWGESTLREFISSLPFPSFLHSGEIWSPSSSSLAPAPHPAGPPTPSRSSPAPRRLSPHREWLVPPDRWHKHQPSLLSRKARARRAGARALGRELGCGRAPSLQPRGRSRGPRDAPTDRWNWGGGALGLRFWESSWNQWSRKSKLRNG